MALVDGRRLVVGLLLPAALSSLGCFGCVVCLFSCPGSKVGNRTYTVRDYVQGTTRFRVREAVLPDDGTEVTVILAPL
jgi:heterodisulfide reductase subunit C